MQLARNTVATLFEINSPIWNGDVGSRVVGLARHRLTKHNEIHFMYRRKSDGELSIPDVFYFDGSKQNQYKTQTVKGTTLVLVPFAELERLERETNVKTYQPGTTEVPGGKVVVNDTQVTDPQVSMFDDIEEVELISSRFWPTTTKTVKTRLVCEQPRDGRKRNHESNI